MFRDILCSIHLFQSNFFLTIPPLKHCDVSSNSPDGSVSRQNKLVLYFLYLHRLMTLLIPFGGKLIILNLLFILFIYNSIS